MTTTTTPLILLKTRSIPDDPYQTLIDSKPAFTPIFVPVLEHQQCNLSQLKDIITSGQILRSGIQSDDGEKVETEKEGVKYGGLIITSQRAVEALGRVIEGLRDSSYNSLPFLHTTTIYVVGPATRAALIKLGFTLTNIHGHESGNGATLAAHILSTYALVPRRLLFLVGETRRDIIPKTLHGAEAGRRVEVEELEVYTTITRGLFGNELRGVLDALNEIEVRVADAPRLVRQDVVTDVSTALSENADRGAAEDTDREASRQASKEEEEKTGWIVVFSPSGTDTALQVVKEKAELETKVKYRICTIGPTTREFMAEKLGVEPDAVAGRPSPEGLMEVITQFKS